MMTISVDQAGKRYNREWIFRRLSYQFTTGKAYAITGPNGSGKSTLLQAIAGSLQLTEGKINYMINGIITDPENHYRSVSIAAPYLELIEEMTAAEFLGFHQQFKSFIPPLTVEEVLAAVELEKASTKQIRFFSSGMKQRLKLAQAFLSDVPVLLLDEPCTNLDSNGIALYHTLIKQYLNNRLVIVCSNDRQEYDFCEEQLSISNYK